MDRESEGLLEEAVVGGGATIAEGLLSVENTRHSTVVTSGVGLEVGAGPSVVQLHETE